MEDPRLLNLINKPDSDTFGIYLLGFPIDTGVRRNNGRPGAAKAPEEIRKQLFKFTPHPGYYDIHTSLLQKVKDRGDLSVSGNLSDDQQLLGEVIAPILKAGSIPVILGGGHETAYGHFAGYVIADQPVTIVNIDAHTDVRLLKDGKPHSGSPFRQALEHPSGLCQGYDVFGLNPAAVAESHLTFIQERGGDFRFLHETTLETVINHMNRSEASHIMVTMDIDAVVQSAAPGVSAPAAMGMKPELWLKLAFEFGKHPKVTSFDISEVNPDFDIDNQTTRLAALTIWNFLLGLSLR